MQCEYNRLWREGADRRCARTVGVRRWWDAAGVIHAACPPHRGELESRHAPADPPEPEWLPESADPVTVAKAEADRWTDPRDTETWSAT